MRQKSDAHRVFLKTVQNMNQLRPPHPAVYKSARPSIELMAHHDHATIIACIQIERFGR